MKFGLAFLLAFGLSAIAGPAARANLVTNGNFATGSFAGWVSPVNPSIVIDRSFTPPGDNNDAAFTGSGTLSQAIATVAGQAYTLSFSLLDEAGFALDSFVVRFDNDPGISGRISRDSRYDGTACLSSVTESHGLAWLALASGSVMLSMTGTALSLGRSCRSASNSRRNSQHSRATAAGPAVSCAR